MAARLWRLQWVAFGTNKAKWKVILPFGLNQLSSVVFVSAVAGSDISLAVRICNSRALVFTAIGSFLLPKLMRRLGGGASALPEEPFPELRSVAGLVLIMVGTAICVGAKNDNGSNSISS